MVGKTSREWLRGDDEGVRERLRAELARVTGAEPEEVLGIGAGEPARPAFLEATKTFHPSRFARRDPATRDLANEVFLLIKAAYAILEDRADGVPAAPIDETPSSATVTQPTRTRTPAETDPEAREELRKRRRQALRQQLTPASGVPMMPIRSQARVASAGDPTDSKIEGDPEARFRLGQALLETGKLAEAALTFKELAVSNPAERKYRLHMHYAWGREAQAQGRDDEARAEYKRALGLDADFALAQKALATLPAAGKKKDGGNLFSKWFRKS